MRSCKYCCSGKVISSTYCECVFVILGIQHAMLLRHISIRGLPGSTTFFPHCLINGIIFEKKYWIKCMVFLHHWSETFLISRRTEQDIIKKKIYIYIYIYIYIGLHVKYPLFLSDFNGNWTLSIDFWKILKYEITWKSVQWEPSYSMWTDGRKDRRTDRHDETKSRFSQFRERA